MASSHAAPRHGPLLKQAPGIRRYVQSHALPQGYRKDELLFDGISELWFDDASAYAACLHSDAFKAIERDYEQNHLKLSEYDKGNPPYDGLVDYLVCLNRRHEARNYNARISDDPGGRT